jgi:hypothetical protein
MQRRTRTAPVSGRRRRAKPVGLRIRRIWIAALAIVALALSLSCGGATPSDLFAPPTSGMDAGPVDTGVITRMDSSIRPPADTGVGPPFDAMLPDTSPPDTSIPIDTNPPPTGLSCGIALVCDSSQYCCATSDPMMMNPTTYACMSGSTSGCTSNGGTPITCDSQDDCNGSDGICCGELDSEQQYSHVRCASSCDTAEDRQFCDPTAIADVCAATGTICGPSTILPGFNVCQ